MGQGRREHRGSGGEGGSRRKEKGGEEPRRWNEEGDQPRRIRPNFSFFRSFVRRRDALRSRIYE